ncbi:MAG: hypothetical protein AAFP90_21200 [Planctomycetota bacterium]
MADVDNDRFIASDELTADVIPARATNWHKVVRFAATFDPRSEHLPDHSSISGVADIRTDSTVAEMRLAIYSEWRRYNHFGYEPDAEVVQRTQSVLDQLRNACPKGRAHLVFLRSGSLLIVKRPNIDWRQLQSDYPDYMTSLGPWSATEFASHFAAEYTDNDSKWPFSRQVIHDFFSSPSKTEIGTK